MCKLKLSQTLNPAQLSKTLSELSSLSLDVIEKALWHGGIFADDQRLCCDKLPILNSGAQIQIYYFLRDPEPIPIVASHLLFEDKGFLAVQKPAWLPIQGSRVSLRFGLEYQLQEYLGLKNLHAVHRLDRETSGIVLFAYDKKIETQLMKQFQEHKVKKTYLAVVASPTLPLEWEVKGYLRRDFRRLPQNYYQFYTQEISHSRYSETHFLKLKTEEIYSLIQASPKTGRTHQIRVHLRQQAAPIVGDSVYGDGDRKFKDFRLQLHAYALEFYHPHSQKRIELKTLFPEDFLVKL